MINRDFNELIQENSAPVKLWTNGVPVDPKAVLQLQNTAKMPFIFKHLAVMPDVHVGKGSTIGSVIPTKGAIIPAAVGVDIGCGMIAVKTSLTASDLPDSLQNIRFAIEAAVPHGRTTERHGRDKGTWKNVPDIVDNHWMQLDEQSAVSAINTRNCVTPTTINIWEHWEPGTTLSNCAWMRQISSG